MSGDANEFNTLLLTATDRALAESMGESVSGAIKACLPIATITTDPNGFASKLEKMTGGAKVVERKIMRNLEIMISKRTAKPFDSLGIEKQSDLRGFIESCRGQFSLK